jgi:hypothetical protein
LKADTPAAALRVDLMKAFFLFLLPSVVRGSLTALLMPTVFTVTRSLIAAGRRRLAELESMVVKYNNRESKKRFLSIRGVQERKRDHCWSTADFKTSRMVCMLLMAPISLSPHT